MKEDKEMSKLIETKTSDLEEKKKYRIPKITKTRNTKVAKNKIGCPICGDTENIQVTGRCVSCLSCGWNGCNL